jgi:hypothetical protein
MNNATTIAMYDMILHSLVDASYLSRLHSRAVAGGLFFLGDVDQPTKIDGIILAFSAIIPCVVASAGEAEYATLFAGAQNAAALRTVFSDLGYPQPDTIILCDNTKAIGIATDSVKQKRSKAIDMRFHWVRDRVRQKQFRIAYIASAENPADYFTNNLPQEAYSRFLSYIASAP